MVGLSIVLEKSYNNNNNNISNKNNYHYPAQVISKATMIKHSPPPSPSAAAPPCRWSFPAAGFLDRCFLCHRKLLAGKDIYMYKGDRGFCSVECRSNQILMDEKEEISSTNYNTNAVSKRDYCSLAAIKGSKTSSESSSSSPFYS